LLKREARILGLSASRKGRRIFVFGVVFRGSLWLDGIVTCAIEEDKQDYTSQIATTLKRSKQYSQLHAIILMKNPLTRGLEIDVTELARKTKLPIITQVSPKGSRRRKQRMQGPRYYELFVNGKHVSVLAEGVTREGAERLFTVSSGVGKIPEAVRVADLLAKVASTTTLFNEP